MLQFVDEHGDWVELVVLVRFHIGQSISGDGEGVLGLATVLDVWALREWMLMKSSVVS